MQGAVYQEIVRQNTGEKLPFYLAAVTKEETIGIDIVHISQSMLDFSLERFANSVEMYDAIKKGIVGPERCGTCDFIKKQKCLQN
ncbi:MAG: hypothetical protein DBY25_06790 [Clostridiales bacterium]|nr:MAG: hypothetical protein DBY25_06790 [Clostridiales bacterium]